MILLYLSLLYLVGVGLGQFAWQAGWLGCEFPGWLWWIPLIMLPWTVFLRSLHWPGAATSPLRWPERAGFTRPRKLLTPALLIALTLCLLTGFLRYAAHPLTPCWTSADLAYYNLPAKRAFDKTAPEILLTGYVSSYPLVKDTNQRLHIMAEQIVQQAGTQRVHGELRLSTGLRERYAYGQPVQLRGRLVTPPDFEDFSYREYLARKGVHSLFYAEQIERVNDTNQGSPLLHILYALRARGEALLNRQLPEPYAALANGMLLGVESGIPDELYEQFNLTGTSHVIVISGSNVAIIAGVLMALGQRLWGRRAIWPTLLGIASYALLVGGDAAVLRAALMGSLFAVATVLDRRSTALVSLAFACWLMTLFNPLTLWDVGFQLSSAATAGLILFSSKITAWAGRLWSGFATGGLLTGSRLAQTTGGLLQGLIQDGLLVTIAANITTLPLVLYYFGRLSLVSLGTNLLIAPVQSFIMLWGSAGVLLGVAGAELLAQGLLWIPWLCLVWTVAAVQWTATLPGASLAISDYGLGKLLVTYGLVALLTLRTDLWTGITALTSGIVLQGKRWLVGTGAALVLATSTVLLWSSVLSQPDGRLHVYFLDIGQGDGILIQTPSGRQVLIDGGASPQQLFQELGAVMPFSDRSLDLVLMTHPDLDHAGAQVFVPDRFSVATALETAISHANPDAAAWRAKMNGVGANIHLQHSGGWLDLGDGVALWVLWPTATGYQGDNADNENSLVTKLVYGDFSVLLTGDAGLPAENALTAAGVSLAATVLKVGHHGSKGSSGPALLAAVDPAVAVIQVGADNDYGHPHQDVLDRLGSQIVLRNDLDGRIHIYSDGHQMWIDTEHGSGTVRP